MGNINLDQFFNNFNLAIIVKITLLIVIGLPFVYLLSAWIKKHFLQKYTPQHGMILDKVFKYSGITIILILILRILGVELTPLLGAAGIIGIAIGFASQTSVSNIISGLFLIAEKPFMVNDVISVGNLTGQVLSIDILSVKLRTFDNKFVRIPNETLIKSEVTTITRFPIRRLEIPLAIAYKENIQRVKQIILEVINSNPIALQEPLPEVRIESIGNFSIDLKVIIWAEKDDYLTLKNSILEELKLTLDNQQIEMAIPLFAMHQGKETKPYPVQIVGP